MRAFHLRDNPPPQTSGRAPSITPPLTPSARQKRNLNPSPLWSSTVVVCETKGVPGPNPLVNTHQRAGPSMPRPDPADPRIKPEIVLSTVAARAGPWSLHVVNAHHHAAIPRRRHGRSDKPDAIHSASPPSQQQHCLRTRQFLLCTPIFHTGPFGQFPASVEKSTIRAPLHNQAPPPVQNPALRSRNSASSIA